MEKIAVEIHTPEIRLDGLLKFSGLVGTGGEAKHLIQSGLVRVNGLLEVHRSRRIGIGDRVELLNEEEQVQALLEVQAAAP